jgi:Protein of unknown function (DUF3048) N-terminal domain/Protein of unknown function (DUF3048) C-terminal domain
MDQSPAAVETGKVPPVRVSRRNPFGAAALLVVAFLGAAACGSDVEAARAPAPTTSPVPTPSSPPPPPPPVVWPLTGEVSEGERAIAHPAVAVKIENSLAARPQTGLGAADMVWEQVVEGGITRYVAVYHSQLPAEIGPVRSVRPMDPTIAAPLGGLFAFSGGQADYIAAIRAAGLQVMNNDAGADGFYRISTRSAPHNVYADPRVFVRLADAGHRTAPARQFDFASGAEEATALSAGAPAAAVALTLSGVSHPSWTWNDTEDAWLRAEDGALAMGADGRQLRATNVVVLRVDVVNTARRDAAGNPVPDTVLVGSGEAVVATGGHTVAATWSKAAPGDPVVLTGPGSAPLRLAPGTTWVELVPNRTGAVSVR